MHNATIHLNEWHYELQVFLAGLADTTKYGGTLA